MRRFRRWAGVILLLASLGGLFWLIWPVVFPVLPQTWLSRLSQADAALTQGRADQAEKILLPIPQRLSVDGWKQWELRAKRMSELTGNWSFANAVAESARRAYPGNVDLAAYCVWVLIKGHHPDTAVEIADRLLVGTPWNALREQAHIEASGWTKDGWGAWLDILSNPDGTALKSYLALTQWNSDPRVAKNALLSALGSGQLEAAHSQWSSLPQQERSKPPFDRLDALLAYDDGDWPRAEALFRSMTNLEPRDLLVLADVFLHQGDENSAQTIYDQLLAQQSGPVSEALATNRAQMALDDHQPAVALAVLQRIQNPTSTATFLVLESRFDLGETASVRSALIEMAGTKPETAETIQAELLKDTLFPDLLSLPRLWSLLHQFPSNAPLAERLAWLLLSQQDFDGVLRALRLHVQSLDDHKEPWWSIELRAMSLATQDKIDDAIGVWKTIPASWQGANYFANLSYLELMFGQQGPVDSRKSAFDAALADLGMALDRLPVDQGTSDHQRRSAWLVRKAELELALSPLDTGSQKSDLLSAALDDLNAAVALDPQNLRASFLLRERQTLTEGKL